MIKLMMNNSGWKNTAYAASNVSAGQPIAKGGCSQKHDLVTPIFAHYLVSSPKNQVRLLGGPKPYIKGTHTAEPKINSELTGTYGHTDKSVKYHFLLTILT
jgi:hypothetical protein